MKIQSHPASGKYEYDYSHRLLSQFCCRQSTNPRRESRRKHDAPICFATQTRSLSSGIAAKISSSEVIETVSVE
eukprot:scaffold271646_cov21-Prasinocladus_malaysianus.AAC.1